MEGGGAGLGMVWAVWAVGRGWTGSYRVCGGGVGGVGGGAGLDRRMVVGCGGGVQVGQGDGRGVTEARRTGVCGRWGRWASRQDRGGVQGDGVGVVGAVWVGLRTLQFFRGWWWAVERGWAWRTGVCGRWGRCGGVVKVGQEGVGMVRTLRGWWRAVAGGGLWAGVVKVGQEGVG